MHAKVLAAALAAVLSAYPASAQDSALPSADSPGIMPPVRIIGGDEAPIYPKAAMYSGAQGVTQLRYTVDVDGTTSDVTVAKSSNHSELDEASVKMVQSWKFIPAMRDGEPVAVSALANAVWIMHRPDSVENCPAIYATREDYPPSAWDHREEGTVQVGLFIGENGNILYSDLEASSGYPDLDSNAKNVLSKRHLTPASINGKSAPGRIMVCVIWSRKAQEASQ